MDESYEEWQRRERRELREWVREMREEGPDACLRCGSRRLVPILYGMPMRWLGEAEERGEIALGGCVVMENSPTWHCNACGLEWLPARARGP